MSAKPLNFGSNMPNVAGALNGWTKKITLTKRTQSVDDYGNVTYSDVAFSFTGTIQPLSPKQLELKPEGERAFTWLQIHIYSGTYKLQPNDLILVNGRIFKIMADNDYSLNGYIEYHAVYDFQNPP